MDALFHYYTVYYLADQAGFSADECYTIAYASQYLDNALVQYAVQTENGVYETLATHHFGFWDKSREWSVWIPFHFFPAGPEAAAAGAARRRDGLSNPLNVAPNSARVKQLLVEALRSRNLHRVGIALHTYADSWAHQDFSGKSEEWNRIDPNSPLPPIGHTQKLRDPDGSGKSWTDPRLRPPFAEISNRTRVLAAAGRIYRYLATYNRRSFADEELVVHNLERILGPPGAKSKEERTNDFIIECSMPEYRRTDWRQEAFEGEGARLDPGFGNGEFDGTVDKLLWLKDELLHRTKLVKKQPVRGKPAFEKSNLYRWDLAAREQLESARLILADLVPSEQ
jgi:hypothetical protein